MTFATNVASDVAEIVVGPASRKAKYTLADGSQTDVSILFFEDPGEIGRQRGARMFQRRARAFVSLADVPTPALTDRIEVGGLLWNVRTYAPGLGWWVMECVLSQRVDHSGAALVE